MGQIGEGNLRKPGVWVRRVGDEMQDATALAVEAEVLGERLRDTELHSRDTGHEMADGERVFVQAPRGEALVG